MKKTFKSFLISALSLLLCFSMLAGTTWAWFTDTETSANNKIVAGNLDIDLELLDAESGKWKSLKDSQAPIFDYDRWEPGYVDAKILKVENEGSLVLRWEAKFFSAEKLSILADVIDVYVCPSATELAYPDDRDLDGYVRVGTVREFVNSIEETTNGVLQVGETQYLGIALKMDEKAGNEYQNLSIGGKFDIRIYATQFAAESDSFDNTYDMFANESVMASVTKTLVDGENEVAFSLTHESAEVATVSVPASALEDPTKPVTVTFDGIDASKTIDIDENTKAFAYDIKVTNLKADLEGSQLVTIVVNVPRALAGMKAYHNGVLIENAVYDEVAGTITFTTSNFSPYAFAYTEREVATLEELRAAVKANNVEIKLAADLEIDLSKGSEDRSEDHVLKSGSSKYYNAVNIIGENVAIDLNGHKITVWCGDAYNSNGDVGALFFVDMDKGETSAEDDDKYGSLNIIDRVGGGYIKMRSSIYAVWAPYTTPSYVDIYSGVFIADSYAGDPIGTALDKDGNPDPVNGTMKNENTNRALIYAGTGGNMNIRGGYFLYNNTPNDTKNRNNGAFNAKDFYEGDTPLLTIHDGVMLINKEYRQNPANTSQPNGSYDDYSVKLAPHCEVVENVAHSVEIDDTTYSTWCRVTSMQPVSLSTEGSQTLYAVGDALNLTVTVHYSYGSKVLAVGEYTIDEQDMTIGGKKNVTVTYTENDKTVSTNIWVDVKDGFNAIVASPVKTMFTTGYTLKVSDFIVNAIASDGTKGDISDYTISAVDMSTVGKKTVTITYTNRITGKVTSTTCEINVVNTTILAGNTAHKQYWFDPFQFYLGNTTPLYYKNYTSAANDPYPSAAYPYLGEFPGGVNGEQATGFYNWFGECEYLVDKYPNNWKELSPSAWYVNMRNGQYGLTVTEALPWTTVGVGFITGYDEPIVGVGYYIDGNVETIKYSTPDYFKNLVQIDPGYQGFIDQYGNEGIVANTKFTLSDFAAGSKHTITWVTVFNDGIQKVTDWTVTMASSFGGESFKDTEKPNVNVIVLSGQSNAAGATVIDQSAIDRFANTDYKNVYIQYKNVYTNDGINVFTQSENDGFEKYVFGIGGYYDTTFGPEAALAYHLATTEGLKDQQWFIIKYTAPGTNLDLHWRQNANLSQKMMDYVEDCVEDLVAEGYDVQIRSLLWMQGENDAIEGAETCANNYAVNEQTLVQNFRIKFAKYATRPNGSVPGSGIGFITAGIAPYGKDNLTLWKNSSIVNAAKVNNAGIWYVPGNLTEYSALYGKVAAPGMHLNPTGGAIYNSAYIDTSLMSTQTYDTAHYDQQSMDWLGTWFGQYVSALMTLFG